MRKRILLLISVFILSAVFIVGLSALKVEAITDADSIVSSLESRVLTKNGRIYVMFESSDCITPESLGNILLPQTELDCDMWTLDVDEEQLTELINNAHNGDNEVVLSVALKQKGTTEKTEYYSKNFTVGIGYTESVEDVFYDYLDIYACSTHGVIDMEFN